MTRASLSAEVLVSAEQHQQITLIGPVAQDTSWQARDGQSFDKTQFTIDWQGQIEGTISQGVRGFDLRYARYCGLAKTRLQHLFIGAALNIVRIGAWLMEQSRAQTRLSRFGKLMRVVSPPLAA